jgi:hypothetical protein
MTMALRELKALGWTPHHLVHKGNNHPMEIVSFPRKVGDVILIDALTIPGDPFRRQTWVIEGEMAGHERVTLMTAQCPKCKIRWQPKVVGEMAAAHIRCNTCHREYFAMYDNHEFVGFAYCGESLKLKGA